MEAQSDLEVCLMLEAMGGSRAVAAATRRVTRLVCVTILPRSAYTARITPLMIYLIYALCASLVNFGLSSSPKMESRLLDACRSTHSDPRRHKWSLGQIFLRRPIVLHRLCLTIEAKTKTMLLRMSKRTTGQDVEDVIELADKSHARH